ncbi:hypothetical protein SAMN04515674_101458 [Pseudarcicella hirudinis]|uniref:Uncharacterized protein n=1 Tax=Pseudarcicella hirudinis TaxID=1079859 RepID=A0A1I5MWB2_9BACT|nr:hypothetical protein [Pseudarcicella hirudinis]SFP13311.1 hypothetical protein SAMN04515674_101458 [Pseudarcicella hirudinis]
MKGKFNWWNLVQFFGVLIAFNVIIRILFGILNNFRKPRPQLEIKPDIQPSVEEERKRISLTSEELDEIVKKRANSIIQELPLES